MLRFSIIICSYNPNDYCLSVLLNSIIGLDKTDLTFEIIIVDNNSHKSILDRGYVLEFMRMQPKAKFILEPKPGLTNARIAGITKAQYDWLVFFDDDNEPASNYLIKAAEAITLHPQTATWGATEVEVEYIGKPASWLQEEKVLFQQRNDTATAINNQPHWQDCYPCGTGLIVQKQIALLYVNRVREKRYTLTDRKGKSLSSGGDVQLVLTGIEQGFYAGIVGGLKIRHLIDTSKASLQYLQKLQYGTASAYVKAYNQVFIHSPLPVELITNRRVFLLVYSLFRIYKPVTTKQRFRLLLASKMGELNARAEVTPQRKPFLLKLYERIIGV